MEFYNASVLSPVLTRVSPESSLRRISPRERARAAALI